MSWRNVVLMLLAIAAGSQGANGGRLRVVVLDQFDREVRSKIREVAIDGAVQPGASREASVHYLEAPLGSRVRLVVLAPGESREPVRYETVLKSPGQTAVIRAAKMLATAGPMARSRPERLVFPERMCRLTSVLWVELRRSDEDRLDRVLSVKNCRAETGPLFPGRYTGVIYGAGGPVGVLWLDATLDRKAAVELPVKVALF